jgi:hypothetical protein
MKKVIIIGLVLLAFLQPDTFCQKNKNQVKVKSDSIAVDSVEYELIVLDPGFDSWLMSKPTMNYYSKQYYETRNRLYVLEWNRRYMNPQRYGGLYDSTIDYYPGTDYGLELNYRLYYYFLFFEEANHIKLIDRGR